MDISEDLRAEEEDPGYIIIKWKLAYLESKLKELEEKEVLRTSTSKDSDERVTSEMILRDESCWIFEESVEDSKDGQMKERSNLRRAEAESSSQGVEDMELE